MSKITNDGLTRSGTRCFLYICTHVAAVGIKGLKSSRHVVSGTEAGRQLNVTPTYGVNTQ